ncbi:MAG: D-glycero-beta-D-manno-heptose-7-phosphate kinase [Armatimonadota bacterium]
MESDWQKRLNSILKLMEGQRVLVIGDVMLDEYVWGNVRRISPEAPVMVVEVERDSYTPGGAANVAKNIQTLGGKALLVGVIGNDEAGHTLSGSLHEMGVKTSGLVVDSSRPTTRKTRIIAHSQQVVRVDRESRRKPSNSATKRLISMVESIIGSVDIVVFSDYDKGMAGRSIVQAISQAAASHRKRVVVNPKPRNVKQFKSMSVISLNQSEAEAATGIPIKDEKSLHRAARRLMNATQPEALLITRGPHGMNLYASNGSVEIIPAHLVEVYDVAGAGDTVVSTLALALAAGASFEEAAVLANCAGGAVVRKVGVATVSRDEIASMLTYSS